MKTCEGIKEKKNHHNNYKERKKKSYILSQTKSCEKEKKNEQLKETHWSPTWVMKQKRNKKDLKLYHSIVKTCESLKKKKRMDTLNNYEERKKILHFILGQEL